MSAITIVYSELEDSVKMAQKVQSEIDGYIGEIRKRVINPSSSLPGSDSNGYVSTAAQLAQQKINQLNEKSSRFTSFEKNLSSFISTAKDKDEYVSNRIEEIADSVIGERKWYQKVGDWFYNTFCVDIANMNAVTKFFSDVSEMIDVASDYATDRIKAWFKYGAGKYVANILTAVVSIIVAIAAVVAIPFTGGTSTVVVVGAVATAISSVIAVVNGVTQIVDNAKALNLYGEGKEGAARYYGNIEKLSDHWEKTDMGDATTNKIFDFAGDTIDTIKVVADVTKVVTSVVNLGAVKDYRFKNPNAHIEKYDWSVKNIKKNILHELGFKSNGKFDWKTLNPFDSIFELKYDKQFKIKGKYQIPETLIQVFKGAKIIDNVKSTVEDIQTISEVITGKVKGIAAVDGVVKAGTGLLDNIDITGWLENLYTPVDVIKDLNDIFHNKIYKSPAQ